ncbi:MAG: resolvase [Gammaproteobacteria bacterium]|nr:resolvase [Gammaproteobacteria bacterium]
MMKNPSVRNDYVAYFRVSTDRQGRSGLGLDAQRSAVQDFLRHTHGTLRAEFVEVQSGKNDFRPQLAEALRLCRLTHATLLIAKLDRLSRNAAFLLTLQNSSTSFIACDMPRMNEAAVGIMAVIAETERKAIGERTRVALIAAKSRGIRLGNPRLEPGNRVTALAASQVWARRATERAQELREELEDAKRQGCKTLRKLAAHLNQLGVKTPQGRQWHASSVRNVLLRMEVALVNRGQG